MTLFKKEPVSYPSTDGRTTVRATVWYPDNGGDLPRGIVQLVHGMSEYIDRYEEFACYLVDNGFLVCGSDHVGHGRSVSDYNPTPEQEAAFANPKHSDEWGHISIEGGHDVLVNDAITLMDSMRTAYPEMPYFVFGHSMGSFVARCLIARKGEGLAGAIICGTGHVPPALSAAGGIAAQTVARTRGQKHVSNTLHGMADGAYAKAIKDAKTDFDWLNTDAIEVQKYIDDPACGFPFTAGGYAALMGLTAECADAKAAALIPDDLPLLFIAGDEDPVGDSGRAVSAAADFMREIGQKDVSVHLYPGMRHEILNEPDHMNVYDDILHWIDAIIC